MSNSFEVTQPQSFETQQPESRLSPFRLIGRHWMLLVLGVIVGGVVGALYYAQATPYYESGLQVLVVNKSRSTLPVTDSYGGGASDKNALENDLATQQTLIRSPVVIGSAVRQGKLTELPSFTSVADPMGAVIYYLKIMQEMNQGKPTNVLNISFRWTDPQDIPAVLTAVIESYQRFLRNRYQSVADDTAKLIIDANTLLEEKITKKQRDYDAFLSTLPTELWRGKDGFNSIQVLLMNLESRRVDFLNREADLQGRIQALDKAMKDGRHSRAELLMMVSQAQLGQGPSGSGGKENANYQATDRLLDLKLQEKNLLEDFGPDHPQVRAVRDQLALLQGRVKFSDKSSEDGADPVESFYRALQLELEYVRMASKSLSQLLLEAHQKAKPLRSMELQNESYRTDIARSQLLFDAIAKRLDEVSILKNVTGGYEAEIINPPHVGAKVAPKAVSVFITALMLGLLAGFGLAYLAEISNQSFQTPEEIRRQLGLPVVGHIPFFPPEDPSKLPAPGPLVDPSLCAYYRPKSREAEAYRGVRTALFFNRGGSRSLIQVTSPDKSDGKSTLIGNLAVSIAQAEKKVILVDADFRRPRVHKLFNLSSEKGLASVMNGEADLDDVILTTAVPGLSVLPCGPIPPNPAELLTLPCFTEALAYLREKYDYVLIDTPPLLAVTDPCSVVPYVDGVLLTIRISKNARPNASRAKEVLSSLGANMIGVVVNGVGTDAKSYGYGYGSYRYGYGGYSYRNYQSYTSYESDASSPSAAAGEHDGRQGGAVDKQRAVSGRGFLTWLFKR